MTPEGTARPASLTAAQFGRGFVAVAADPARVAEIVGRLLGEEIRFGPVKVGPGGMASSKAVGVLESVVGCLQDTENTPVATAASGDGVPEVRRMLVKTRVALRITTMIGGRLVRFHATLGTLLHVRVSLEAPLDVVITIAPLADEDIDLRLTMPAFAARALRRLGNIDDLVRQHVKGYVRDMLEDPRITAYTRFDVTALVDRAFATGLIVTSAVESGSGSAPSTPSA
ncbi:MAG: hypothetical protein ACRDRL_00710 [Sciscionella sp.]